FYISGHPLDRFREELSRLTTCSIQDLSHEQDRSTVLVAGVVESMKIKRTKKGDKMAVVSLEDLSGSIEVIIFPDLFSYTSSLLKSDEPLLVNGSLEKTETSLKIIAKELTTLDAAREKILRALELPLNEEMVKDELLQDIKALAFTYPGECQLRFRIKSSNGDSYVVVAHNRYRVMPAPELISNLETLLGTQVRKLTS
ncbi:MAG: DNA polymerase III subunit alpha, partial [Deltaproteobacteria bacterium]